MLIGLTGAARCGKDTIAEWLIENEDFTRVAFADPLKRMTETLLDMHPETLEEMKDKTLDFLGVTPRRILQTLGTDWGRKIIREDIWLRFAAEKIGVLQAMGKTRIVITDVRFDNEAAMIQNMGGQVYRICRPGCPEVEAHVSEAGIAGNMENGRIYNNGTLEELYEMLPDFLGMLEAHSGLKKREP